LTGDIGIGTGTSTPGARLEVRDTTEQLRLSYDASNYLSATISSAGIATLNPTGNAIVLGGGTTATELRFLEPSASGTNYTAFKAPAQGSSITYTLPDTIGGANSYLKDVAGDGVLSWATVAGGVMSQK
jgi:hypothetical protein